MSFPTDSPCVRLRLSRKEVRLILPGLRKVVAADRLWIEQRYIVRAAKDADFWRHDSRTELYDPVAMMPFRETLTKLSNLGGAGGRLRFDVFQLAGCAFAVRHTATMVRHRHIEPWLEDHNLLTRQLLRKLERYRRRARRLFEARLGSGQFGAAARVWRDLLCWIRAEFIWCRCRRSKGWGFMHRWFTMIIDQCCVLAVEALTSRSVIPPSPYELRMLVRRALRSARRRITGPPVGALWRKPHVGREFLAQFIIRMYGPKLRSNDISTRQSRLFERLASLNIVSHAEHTDHVPH